MPDRLGNFYGIWPTIDGKALNKQWGEIRSNTAESKAVIRNSIQQLETGVDELNALRSYLGQQYGDLDFENSYRLIYDETTQEFCLQVNNGTVIVPEWNDSWCIRRHDGQFQVVSTGGISSTAGFYGPLLDRIGLVADSHSLGTDTDEDVAITNPSKIFFDRDSGLKVRQIDCGAHSGAPEVTFTAPFGRAQVFEAAGREWVVEHNFNTSPVMVQVMDQDDKVITPDTVDVSDPNIAYFYFSEVFIGSVIVASGGTGAASLKPRDPFYLVVRTDNQSAATRTLRPNADLIFNSRYFYVEAHEDIPNCRARPWAFVSLKPEIFYLDELIDVEITNPGQGHTLFFDAANKIWRNSAGGSGAVMYLNDLKDVDAPAPQGGSQLGYNSASGFWEPQDPIRTGFIFTQGAASAEWQVAHGQNSTLLIAQIFDNDDRLIYPDVADFSNPDVTYFYFTEPVDGRAFFIASGPNDGEFTHFVGGITKTFEFNSDVVEWQCDHNFDNNDLLWNVYTTGGKALFPDQVYVADPNTAYFYFVEAQSGKAVLTAAAGAPLVSSHADLTGLSADDHTQYLLVNGTRAMTGILDMGGKDIHNAKTGRFADIVEAEAFYLESGSGGEIYKRGNNIVIRSFNGQVVIDDELLVSNKVVAEAYYLKDGGEVAPSVFNIITDGTNVYTAPTKLNVNVNHFYLSSDLDGAPVLNLTNTPWLPRGYIDGFRLERVDATTIKINPGVCSTWSLNGLFVADKQAGVATLNAPFFKVVGEDAGTGGWEEGSGNEGVPNDMLGNDQFFNTYLLLNSSTGKVDFGFDKHQEPFYLIAEAAASGYDQYRRVGCVENVSGSLRQFFQRGDRFTFLAPTDYTQDNPGTSAVEVQVAGVPKNIETEIVADVWALGVTFTGHVFLSSPLQTDQAAGGAGTITIPLVNGDDEVMGSVRAQIPTDNGKLRYRASASEAGFSVNVDCHGYIDRRERDSE